MVDFSKHLKRNKQMATKETAAPQNNALVIAKKIGIAEAVAKVLTPTQIGWLRLEHDKRKLTDSLQKQELDIQQKCNVEEYTVKDLSTVQGLIKQAKATFGEMKEERLRFTNMINEKLIVPAMEFEKRSEEVIKKASAKELQLRTEAAEANRKVNAKQEETQKLTAHVKNEWARIAATYRKELAELTIEAYENALNRKAQIPPGQVKAYLKKIKDFFKELKLQPMQKFGEFKHLSIDEAKKIVGEIKKYDPKEDLEAACVRLDERFEMYERDFKNATKAIAAFKKEVEEEKEQIETDLEMETSLTDLTAQAGASTTIGLNKNEQVKEQLLVVVEPESEEWALSVMRGFIANWVTAMKHVQVKSLEKLTVLQMSTAIGKMYSANPALKFPGLEFKKVVK